MNSSCPELALDDVCVRITDGAHHSPRSVTHGLPMASVKDLTEYGINLSTCRLISVEDFETLVRQGCRPEIGDVLIAKDGASALETVCEIKEALDVVLLSSVAILRPNPAKILPAYLRYYLSAEPTRRYMKNAFTTGAAIPRTVLKDFKQTIIRVPAIPTQRKIAAIHSAYDDLIENNLRRIKILEEMAQLVYREWFVHFHFPGHESVQMVDSPLGPIPEGWEVGRVGDFGAVLTGKTPSTKLPENFGDYMPFIKIPDMRGGLFCIETEQSLSHLGVASQKNKTIPANSLCVSCIGTPGIVAMTTRPSQTNQQINSIVLRELTHREFLYFVLSDLRETIAGYGATGATMANLSKGKFEALQLVWPGDQICSQFHVIVAPHFEQIRTLQMETANLRRTRDLLLPKLMSSELDVTDLHIDTGGLGE